MKTAGILAEYNPFHKGHAHHISYTKDTLFADHVIVLLSGDFTQRGECAIIDKYSRARSALLAGASLVLELPSVYATSSAEIFCGGAVSIFNKLNIIDNLSFGSECGNIDELKKIAETLINKKDDIDPLIKEGVRSGLSYPKAQGNALSSLGLSENIYDDPNNILGIEYCKAILKTKSSISPVTVKRVDNGYDSDVLDPNSQFASAKAIRKLIIENDERYTGFIPEYDKGSFDKICINDMFSSVLYSKLLEGADTGFCDFIDVTPDLSNKIIKNLKDYKSFSDFVFKLKSKDNTYVRVSRMLIHIMLEMKKELLTEPVNMIRILGFRKDSQELLNLLKKRSDIELISKLADAKEDALLKRDIQSALLYEQVRGSFENEYRRSPVIV